MFVERIACVRKRTDHSFSAAYCLDVRKRIEADYGSQL